jgi:hypothetical protein
MLVTEVEMLMGHASSTETATMLDWLAHDEKFLFDGNVRFKYGFPNRLANWDRRLIRINSMRQTGRFIDFRFTLSSYIYPHYLVEILHLMHWKVKSRFREGRIDEPAAEPQVIRWGRWTNVGDLDFPVFWDAHADRARQEGRATHALLNQLSR